jgi:hypothetical protein
VNERDADHPLFPAPFVALTRQKYGVPCVSEPATHTVSVMPETLYNVLAKVVSIDT